MIKWKLKKLYINVELVQYLLIFSAVKFCVYSELNFFLHLNLIKNKCETVFTVLKCFLLILLCLSFKNFLHIKYLQIFSFLKRSNYVFVEILIQCWFYYFRLRDSRDFTSFPVKLPGKLKNLTLRNVKNRRPYSFFGIW